MATMGHNENALAGLRCFSVESNQEYAKLRGLLHAPTGGDTIRTLLGDPHQ